MVHERVSAPRSAILSPDPSTVSVCYSRRSQLSCERDARRCLARALPKPLERQLVLRSACAAARLLRGAMQRLVGAQVPRPRVAHHLPDLRATGTTGRGRPSRSMSRHTRGDALQWRRSGCTWRVRRPRQRSGCRPPATAPAQGLIRRISRDSSAMREAWPGLVGTSVRA